MCDTLCIKIIAQSGASSVVCLLLLRLEQSYEGVRIGSISVPNVTVADDLELLACDQ